MFYVVPYGISLMSAIKNFSPIIAKFETIDEARKHVEERNKHTKRHYNILEIKTVWTTMSLDELLFASSEDNSKTESKYKPVNAVEVEAVLLPTKTTPAVLVEPAPVEAEALYVIPDKGPYSPKRRTYKKSLCIFDGPMPADLKSVHGTIALNEVTLLLGLPGGVIMRLADEGKINMYNNGLAGNRRRYFIPAADLRRLFKVKQEGTA
jgi:hypothetical protein